MTKVEFKKSLEIAQSDRNLSHITGEKLLGYGLSEFRPTVTTIDEVALMIRWQTIMFNGYVNMEELNSLFQIAKRKFLIVG